MAHDQHARLAVRQALQRTQQLTRAREIERSAELHMREAPEFTARRLERRARTQRGRAQRARRQPRRTERRDASPCARRLAVAFGRELAQRIFPRFASARVPQ